MMIVALADFFLFAFTVETFAQKRRYLVPFGIASAAIIVFLTFFWDPLINWAAVMILSLVTYSILAYLSIGAMRLAKMRSYKYGFGLIASSNIFLSLFFVFMSVDRLTGRWTPFLFLAWTILFIASLLTFVGYTLPPWFKKLLGEP